MVVASSVALKTIISSITDGREIFVSPRVHRVSFEVSLKQRSMCISVHPIKQLGEVSEEEQQVPSASWLKNPSR